MSDEWIHSSLITSPTMSSTVIPVLALLNDILQAAVVIFGFSVVLFNLRHSFRDRVTRAFSALIVFVIIVYLTELLISSTPAVTNVEAWLRLEWVGIAMVPAAQYHLADALLATTGALSRRRRLFVRVFYLTGLAFLLLVVYSDLIVGGLVGVERAPHLRAGPFFPLFALYFWLLTAVGIYFVWRARQRCLTSTTRRRMTVTLGAFLAAPLGVFPYLLISSNPRLALPLVFWLLLLTGNVVVGVMFSFLTYYLAYFGKVSPDRVVRVRLFKYMARVPLAALLVLLVIVLVGRTSSLLGLPSDTALAFSVVLTVLLVEWLIHVFKRPLEIVLQLNNEPDVRRIQELGERLLTTRDMRQFLESVLAAICNSLRTPTAFVAAITAAGPKLEVVVGPLQDSDEILRDEGWQDLANPEQLISPAVAPHTRTNGLRPVNNFIVWREYWLRPLYSRRHDLVLGILGVRARAPLPNLTADEETLFTQLATQAAAALEDRLLQEEVFTAVEGLLPEIAALQKRRSAAAYGGAPALTQPLAADKLLGAPEFPEMVRDALNHYWGGPKLMDSPLMGLKVVQTALDEHGGSAPKALRAVLLRAIEQQKPPGERSMTTAEWILYNILELKFVQGRRVRDVALRLAMSESDLYRKQRVAIENVARTIANMERAAVSGAEEQG
ncbi:MAG: hypothetical protein AB1791_15670, partial [Chloroflexota bacterium]